MPSNQCRQAICTNGVCDVGDKPDGTECDDRRCLFTQTDTCQAGACMGGNPVICTALDQCHDVGVCNTTTGVCSNPEKADGTACNDNDKCTNDDVCTNGVCDGTTEPDETPCGGQTSEVCCGGACVDRTTDRDNCGACGRECGAGGQCEGGTAR